MKIRTAPAGMKIAAKALGVLLVVGSAYYLIDMLAAFLAPDLGQKIHSFIAIPFTIAEIWMVGYLLAVGVKNAKTVQADLLAAAERQALGRRSRLITTLPGSNSLRPPRTTQWRKPDGPVVVPRRLSLLRWSTAAFRSASSRSARSWLKPLRHTIRSTERSWRSAGNV